MNNGNTNSRPDQNQVESTDPQNDAGDALQPEQYWVIDARGEIIYRATGEPEATAYASAFKRGCQILGVARASEVFESDNAHPADVAESPCDSNSSDETDESDDPSETQVMLRNPHLTNQDVYDIDESACFLPVYGVVRLTGVVTDCGSERFEILFVSTVKAEAEAVSMAGPDRILVNGAWAAHYNSSDFDSRNEAAAVNNPAALQPGEDRPAVPQSLPEFYLLYRAIEQAAQLAGMPPDDFRINPIGTHAGRTVEIELVMCGFVEPATIAEAKDILDGIIEQMKEAFFRMGRIVDSNKYDENDFFIDPATESTEGGAK